VTGDHAKKEMVTGEKPATSHGKAPSRESGNKKKEGSHSRIRWREEEENEESGLLRDRLFIALYFGIRRRVHHF
jgi:hypothetical protein